MSFRSEFELKLCIWDWKSYNNGIGNWKWFDYDELDEIEEYINKLAEKGLEEAFICDYECSHKLPVNNHTDISSVLNLVNSLDEIEEVIEDRIIRSDIYEMGEFEDVFRDYTPTQLATVIHFGQYNPMDEYFTFDGYSNIKTLNTFEYQELITDIESDVLSEYL
jgi:hypothetical protein